MLIATELVTQPVPLVLAVVVTSVISSLVAAYVAQRYTQQRFQKEVQEYEAKVRQRDAGLGDHLKIACNIVVGYRRDMPLDIECPMDRALGHLQYSIQVLTGETPTGDAPMPGQGVPGFE